MAKPIALILCGDGINCDAETQWALEYAGFSAVRLHTSSLLEAPRVILNCQLFVIPGGFSFGDEIASGKVLGIKLKDKLQASLHQFIDRGNLLLGICNGFQVLVQMGLLPHTEPEAPRVVSLAHNASGKFINRWVDMEVTQDAKCVFLRSLDRIQLPIRHGEGRLCVKSESEAVVRDRGVIRYKSDINGSFDRIAGLTNASGNVLGLMPHPEAFVRWNQHPAWTSWDAKPQELRKSFDAEEQLANKRPDGLSMLMNAATALS